MKRIHKYKSDFGLADYRNFYKDNYGDIDDLKYSKMVRQYFKAVRDLIVEKGYTYTIPHLRFKITIRKIKIKPKIVDGVLINNKPINWKATKELWEKDEDAKEKKLLVRYNNYETSGYIIRIYLKKFGANVKNQRYYKFRANRVFQRSLAKRNRDPNKDMYDAYLLYETN